jgi:hypothetical protein
LEICRRSKVLFRIYETKPETVTTTKPNET